MQRRPEQFDKSGRNLSRRLNLTAAVLLVSFFLPLNLGILAGGGIRVSGDSSRYLNGAENLRHGLPLTGNQTSYLGYVALIAFCERTGVGLPGVIAIQLVMAALAAAALYDLGRRLHGYWAGLIAAALFVANPDLARWHAALLTDSLYISLVILSVWCVHLAARHKRYWYLLAALTLVAAALVRPNGLFLMAVAVLYLVGRAIPRKSLRWLAISGIVLTFVLGMITVSRFYPHGSRAHPGLTLRRGVTGIKTWRLSMPPDSAPVTDDWAEALGYVARHPFAYLRLAAARVAIELFHIRPSQSTRYKIMLLATLPFLYLLALVGLKHHHDGSLAHLMILVVIVHLIIVALTFADWDGRYLLYILPLICLFSSCAMASWIDLYLSRRFVKASIM